MNMPTETDDVDIPFSAQLTEPEYRKVQLATLPRIFRIWRSMSNFRSWGLAGS